MNIANISQIVQQPVKTAKPALGKTEGFGSIISSALKQANANGVKNSSTGTQKVTEEAKQLVQSNDLQRLLDLMEVDVEEFEKVLTDGEIDFQQLADLLAIDPKELIKTISTMLNGTSAYTEILAEDISAILQAVKQKMPEIQREIVRSLKGEGLPAQSTIDAIKFFKTLELVLPKTDLTAKLEAQTFSLKEMMTKLETVLVQSEKTAAIPFQTMVKVIDIKTDAVEGTQMQIERIVTKTESHSVTLPAARSTQGEALVKEFQAIMNRSSFGHAGGATKLLIKIYPENLGTVRIELIQKDGVLTARLLSSTALGKELLDSQSQQLRQAFAQQNLTVDRLEISQALQDPARHDRNQSFGQQFKQQQGQEQQERTDQEQPEESFLDMLMEAEV